MTSSPNSRRPFIKFENLIFIPETWLKGLGSTNIAIRFLLLSSETVSPCTADPPTLKSKNMLKQSTAINKSMLISRNGESHGSLKVVQAIK